MYVPGDLDRNIGYVMEHLIAPNGGGTRVNQYTLIMDVIVGTTGSGAASMWQVSSTDNTDDGDLFWQGSNFGQGTGGYNGTGIFTAGAWHRVVAAYDMAANPPVVTKYVDGVFQDDWTANQGLDNPRRALLPTAILFGDGDQDERREWWVNAVQIRAGKLTDAELCCSAALRPAAFPSSSASTVAGQWDFRLRQLPGHDRETLQYLDRLRPSRNRPPSVSLQGSPNPGSTVSRRKSCTSPVTSNRNIGYMMAHLIAPNGGGTRVNQYTLIIDALVDTTGPGAASLLDPGAQLDNSDDGDLFWQGSELRPGHRRLQGHGRLSPPANGIASRPLMTWRPRRRS